jgi:hypothetical protein
MMKKRVQKPTDDQVFELTRDVQNAIFSTPDQRKNYRASQYETGADLVGRFSTPIDNSKRHSLDPNY